MPDFLVSGRIFYFLDFECRVQSDSLAEAKDAWEVQARHHDFDVNQLQYDTERYQSTTKVEPEDADVLCPHCGSGADVYDSSYCENCGTYRDAETAAYGQ